LTELYPPEETKARMAHLMGSSSMGTPSALTYRAVLPDIGADPGIGSADIFSPEAEMRALRANRRVNEEAAKAIREATARIDLDGDSAVKVAAFPESLEAIDETRRRIVLEAMAAAAAAAAANATAARAEASEAAAEAAGVVATAHTELADVVAVVEVTAVCDATTLESPQPPPLPAYFLLKPALAPPTPLAVLKPASSEPLWGPHTPAWAQQRKVGFDGLDSIDDLGRFVDAAAVITTPLTPLSPPGSAKKPSRSAPFWDREGSALVSGPPASPARPKRMSPLKPGFSLSAVANRAYDDTENAGPNSPHVASASAKDRQAIAAIAAIARTEDSCARGSPVEEIEEEIIEEIEAEIEAEVGEEFAHFNLWEEVSPHSAVARLDAAAGEAVAGLEEELEEWRLAAELEEEQPPPLEEGPVLGVAAQGTAEVSPHTAAWQEYARLRKLSAGTPGWSTPGRTMAMEAAAGLSPSLGLSPGEAEAAAPYNPWLEYARLRQLSEDALCLTPPLPPARRRDCWWDRGVMVVEPLHEESPPPLPPAARVLTPPRRRADGWAPAWAPAWAKRAAPPLEEVVGVASLLAQLMVAGALYTHPARALHCACAAHGATCTLHVHEHTCARCTLHAARTLQARSRSAPAWARRPSRHWSRRREARSALGRPWPTRSSAPELRQGGRRAPPCPWRACQQCGATADDGAMAGDADADADGSMSCAACAACAACGSSLCAERGGRVGGRWWRCGLAWFRVASLCQTDASRGLCRPHGVAHKARDSRCNSEQPHLE
jgi:hypothetical protein